MLNGLERKRGFSWQGILGLQQLWVEEYASVHSIEGSLCRYCRGLHLSRSFLSSRCLGLSNFPFLQKEGMPIGKPCTWTQMTHLSAGWEDMAEGFS